MRTRSTIYWRERAEQLQRDIDAKASLAVEDVISMYERSFNAIDRDVRKIVREFSNLSGTPEEKARQYINSRDEAQIYAELVRLMDSTADPARKLSVANMINAQAYGARITRLEAIKLNAYIHLHKVVGKAAERVKPLYKDVYKHGSYQTIYDIAEGMNCGVSFSLVPEKAIEKVIEAPFHGKNYSQRIWDNAELVAREAQNIIGEGLLSGESYAKMAEKLAEVTDNCYYNAYRVIHSDVGHYMEEARFEQYQEIGIQKYRYFATLGKNTCSECAELDGQSFLVSERIEGKNAPKMHPHCRCITIIDDAELTTRIARDPITNKNYKVDGNMTFAEWKEGLTDEQRQAINKYTRKTKKQHERR